MDLFTLTAIAEKVNKELDLGNKGADIPKSVTGADLDDAFTEIQLCVDTLSSVLLQLYGQRKSVSVSREGFKAQLSRETYQQLQKIKKPGEADSEAVVRLAVAEAERLVRTA